MQVQLLEDFDFENPQLSKDISFNALPTTFAKPAWKFSRPLLLLYILLKLVNNSFTKKIQQKSVFRNRLQPNFSNFNLEFLSKYG